VKPPPFEYLAPRGLEEAVSLLGLHAETGKVLAGGQSLVPMLSLRLASPGQLIDINRVEGLDYVKSEDGGLRIGATARQLNVERSADVATANPLLVEALSNVAHPPIRRRGTIVGSIAHADPAAELPAVWLALDGKATLRSGKGSRTVDSSGFYSGYFTTEMAPDELLTDVWMRNPKPGEGWSFLEVSRRQGDFALVGAVTLLSVAGGKISDCRLVLLGVGGTPFRATAAESALKGARPDDEAFRAAEAKVRDAVTPENDVHVSADYRRHVAGVMARRGLHQAAARAASSRGAQ
jgi:aerobic carbon-monoxide dehydrogenase medium subunit